MKLSTVLNGFLSRLPAQASDLDLQQYEGQFKEFNILSFALSELFLDGDREATKYFEDINPNNDEQLTNIIAFAKSLAEENYTFADDADPEIIDRFITAHSVRFLGNALVSKVTRLDAEQQRALDPKLQPEDYKISQTSIETVNEYLQHMNESAYLTILSFMQFSKTEMLYFDMIDIIKVALVLDDTSNSDIFTGYSFHEWFNRTRIREDFADILEKINQDEQGVNFEKKLTP